MIELIWLGIIILVIAMVLGFMAIRGMIGLSLRIAKWVIIILVIIGIISLLAGWLGWA
jgi:uncharacterized membrane protein YtjA (UPF0391 family)